MLATEIAASPVTYGASVLWDNRPGVYTQGLTARGSLLETLSPGRSSGGPLRP